jgi:hypothetical protein
MISQIPTPKRTNKNKVQGEFYPLQKDELMALRQAKLINNAAFVHLALRYENPFCDRPIEILPKEFSLRWCIPESSVYEAIGRLKKLGVLLLKTGKVIVEWVKDKITVPVVDLSQENDSESSEKLQDSIINSEMSEKILRSQNNLRDPRIDSEMSENRSLKPLSIKDSDSLQTIQTIQTNQTEMVAEEKFNIQNSPVASKEKESSKNKNLETSTEKQARILERLITKSSALPSSVDNDSQISAELKAKLKKLNIGYFCPNPRKRGLRFKSMGE